jgi:peroxin-7
VQVEFSPFVDNLLAVGTAQYFGIIGNGRQNVFEVAPTGELIPVRAFDTPEGVYDCAWSELHGQQLVSACANGALKLWHLQTRDNFPIQNYHEHKQEVSGVNWSLMSKDMFASASWDNTVKVWKPELPHSLLTLAEHTKPVYNVVWNTQNAGVVASCSGDGTLKMWDLNSARCVSTVFAHNNEVLAMDWNKYNPFELVSGSADCSIKIWVRLHPPAC